MALEDSQDVQVRAVLRGRIECLPCPEENGVQVPCQPCVDMVILSEAPESPEDGKVYVMGRAPDLVVGRSYDFRIRLRPGYLAHLHDSSPLYWQGAPYLELLDAR
jgi:hypothetical protein